ncbi:MAG: thioredoxin family protein [Bacteroidales bacterium]|nr:thioredoxin family protein [Bacteroidales bacterium]
MKTVLITMVTLLMTGNLMAQGIQFEKGQLSEVLQKAKSENKIVFVDVYTTWCGPCKQMSKNIFPLKEVGDFYNTHFISYKLDAENVSYHGPQLAEKYEVKGYPAYLFLNGDGELIYKSGGAMPVETFLKIGRAALGEDILAEYKRAIIAFDKGDCSDTVLYILISQYGDWASGISDKNESENAYARYNKACDMYLQRKPEKFSNTSDLSLLSKIYHQQGIRRGHALVEYLINNYEAIAANVDEKTLADLLMYVNYSSIEESAYEGQKENYKRYINDISGSLKSAYAFNDESVLPAIPFLTAKGDMEYAIGQKDYDAFIEKYELFLSFNKAPGAIDYLMPARRILDMGKGNPTVAQLKKCIPFNQIAYDKYKNAYVCTDFGLLMAKVGEKAKAKAYYMEAFELFKEQGERGLKAIDRYKAEMAELNL